jgi:adenine-specific DNA-methyltransferase
MNTLNYIGCKNSLLSMIKTVIKKNIKETTKLSFMDLFAGTGIVGFNMINDFKTVYSNDLEYYSFIINNGILTCSFSEKLKSLIQKCNELKPVEGLIYNNFCPNQNCERMFFTPENGKKADSIRQYIGKLYDLKDIDNSEYHFLLASLLTSLDKVANTTSVYGAYLKHFKSSSIKPLVLNPIHTKVFNKGDNQVFNQLSEVLVETQDSDVVYMDPPYNNRQYAANYSPLNYISMYDEKINIKGKTGLLENYNKSSFCVQKQVTQTFKTMIKNVKCKYLILSYNDEGIMKFEDIKNILLEKGDLILYKIKYKRYKSGKKDVKTFVYEYLWFVTVNSNNFKFYEEIELTE